MIVDIAGISRSGQYHTTAIAQTQIVANIQAPCGQRSFDHTSHKVSWNNRAQHGRVGSSRLKHKP